MMYQRRMRIVLSIVAITFFTTAFTAERDGEGSGSDADKSSQLLGRGKYGASVSLSMRHRRNRDQEKDRKERRHAEYLRTKIAQTISSSSSSSSAVFTQAQKAPAGVPVPTPTPSGPEIEMLDLGDNRSLSSVGSKNQKKDDEQEHKMRQASPEAQLSAPPAMRIAWQKTYDANALKDESELVIKGIPRLVAVLANALVLTTENPALRYFVRFDAQGNRNGEVEQQPLIPTITPPITAVSHIRRLNHGFITAWHEPSKKEYVIKAATGEMVYARDASQDSTGEHVVTRIVACNQTAQCMVAQSYRHQYKDRCWIYETWFIERSGSSSITKELPVWLDNFIISDNGEHIAARRADGRRFSYYEDMRRHDYRGTFSYDDYVTVFKNEPGKKIIPLLEPLRMSDHTPSNSPIPMQFLPDGGLLVRSEQGYIQRFSPAGTREPERVIMLGNGVCNVSIAHVHHGTTWCMVSHGCYGHAVNLVLITPTSRQLMPLQLQGYKNEECELNSLTMSDDGRTIALAVPGLSSRHPYAFHIVKLEDNPEAPQPILAPNSQSVVQQQRAAAMTRGHFLPVWPEEPNDECVIS